MIVRLYGDDGKEAVLRSRELIIKLGHTITDGSHYAPDIGVAPLLREKLSTEDIDAFKYGVLVFHPSLLPHRRGPSAIKHAYLAGDPVTAATWFWANSRLDAGDICEMEVVRINYFKTYGQFYEQDIIPALLRSLERCLNAIESGYIRRVQQVEEYASYDPKI
ncbi:MAG: cytosolic 10-formyltetrahydrofolate dehydrogenase-like isoform [Bacteroidetes bacterium]|nr:cytosolic 10-formyltetrahydrofolate dehydrogenase-like isoform [Bacteroidota bacterium]